MSTAEQFKIKSKQRSDGCDEASWMEHWERSREEENSKRIRRWGEHLGPGRS